MTGIGDHSLGDWTGKEKGKSPKAVVQTQWF